MSPINPYRVASGEEVSGGWRGFSRIVPMAPLEKEAHRIIMESIRACGFIMYPSVTV